MSKRLALIALVLSLSTAAAQAAPHVVATIKPVHALVAAVMDGVGEPALIVKGASSPHTYALKPSDAAVLAAADVVFWTGHDMELFLADKLQTLAPKARSVPLSEAEGIVLLPLREGGMFEAHDHADDHGDDDHGDQAGHDDHSHEEGADMHVFLDPANAKAMVGEIADVLAELDPENASTYASNAAREQVALDELIAGVQAMLDPVKDKPVVVFHDAYQYFERRFGLNVVGSITVSPDVAPGAERIAEIRAKLGELSAACVFAEPQFQPRIVETLVAGTSARIGTLDPEGADIPEGRDMYATLLRNLAQGLVACLE